MNYFYLKKKKVGAK